jgi:hypothetical protein
MPQTISAQAKCKLLEMWVVSIHRFRIKPVISVLIVLVLVLALFIGSKLARAEVPEALWSNTYEGLYVYSAIQTEDGGYALAGYLMFGKGFLGLTSSFGFTFFGFYLFGESLIVR